MKRLVLILFVAVASLAQTETSYPPDHWCLAGPPLKKDEAKAHECHCTMSCEPDPDGNEVRIESKACAMFCAKDRCRCHDDEGCKPPKG